MNALLIYPEFPETFWSFKHALKFLGKRAAQPPLGLMTVAALLPHAWNKRLVDTNVERLCDRDLAWADVVLLSAMHIQRESLLAIVERCRASGLRTVVGGPIASSVPAAELNADHVVIGEAESLLAGLARELEEGTARPIYQAAEKPEMDTSPLPDLSLIKMRRYSTMTVQYSRVARSIASSATLSRFTDGGHGPRRWPKCWPNWISCGRQAGGSQCLSSTTTSSVTKLGQRSF